MLRSAFLWLIVCVIFTGQSLQAQVVVNEVMASNGSTLLDEDGDSPDWIELLNAGDNAINLENYGISDDRDEPFKFLLPNVELAPGGFYVMFASDKNRTAEDTNIYWETVIRQGDETQYLVPSASVPDTWVTPAFNDQSWQTGTFGIGYGDGDDATTVSSGTISVFTRTRFTIADVSEVSDLKLHIDYDDGYVAYLNGTEISRASMSGTSPIPYNQGADTYTEPRLAFGNPIYPIELGEFKDLLVEGENVLSIQLHNSDTNSSDLTLIPYLSVGFKHRRDGSRGVPVELDMDEYEVHLLHLNFKISASGETVYLSSPDQTVVDSLVVPKLMADESFGRVPGRLDSTNIFIPATPFEANTSQGYVGRSVAPVFSQAGGFYNEQFSLELQDPSLGDYVHFTADGSTPTQNSTSFGSQPSQVAGTFTIKAKTFEPGKLPSAVVVETYFVGEQHELPVVSVSTSPDNLWSDDHGIYVRGTNGVAGNCENGPVNWNQDWEIPVHVELYETDGSRAFVSGAGAKIFGGCSRQNPAKSLSIFFRNEYGNGELNYKLFESKEIDSFQGFVLRNSGNDFTSQGNTMIRDGLMVTLAEGADIDFQAFRPAVLYLNGEYWGIHNIREKINEHFVAANSESDPDNIDLLEGDGWLVHGSADSYQAFISFLQNNNLADEAAYQEVEKMIDMDNYIDYMAAQIYAANTDWPGNNIKYWRDRGEGGKFRWIMYDTDFGFDMSYGGHTNHNTLNFALEPNGPGWPNPSWSTYVFRQMVKNANFVTKFANRMADFMNTRFEPTYVVSVIDSLSNKITSEIPRHMEKELFGQRWGNSVEEWENGINVLRNFATFRPNFIESYFSVPKSQGGPLGIGALAPLKVDVSDAEQGIVQVNRVRPSAYPWSGDYFSRVDVPVKAIAKPGYIFTGWTGDVEATVPNIVVQAGQEVTAHFTEAVGGQTITINEIMYNAADETDSGDWVELYNPTTASVNIAGWELKDEDDDHSFVLPDGLVIEAGAYIVLVQEDSLFNLVYGSEITILGDFGFGLAGGSDQVRLYDSVGALVDSVEYDDDSPWPTEPDGNGFTLELIDAELDNSLPASWAASEALLGSPGVKNGVTVAVDEAPEIPSDIQLNQNYPNPFNPTTVISYQLPEHAKVRLKVYDLTGRTIADLVNDVQMPGSYQVYFEASNLASGVYFYRLDVGAQSFIKKMTLIK